MLLNCSRHHTKERNARNLGEEERVRKHTKVAFNDCKYRLLLMNGYRGRDLAACDHQS